MANAAGAGTGKDDSGLFLLLIGVAVLLIIVGFIFWKYIVVGVVWAMRAESWVVGPFIGFMPDATQLRWAEWERVLAAPNIDSWAKVQRVLSVGGEWFRVHAIVIGVGVALWILKTDVTRRWCGTWSLQRLLEYNASVWPRVAVTLGLPGNEAEADRGPWGRAKTPIEWALGVNAIKLTSGVNPTVEMGKRGGPSTQSGKEIKAIGALDAPAAWRAFAAQLGPLWDPMAGIRARPFHERLLFAVFTARIMGGESTINGAKRKWDWATWLDVAGSGFVIVPSHPWWKFWGKPALWGRWKGKSVRQVRFMLDKTVCDDIDACCKAAMAQPDVTRVIDRHAYLGTVFSALLEASRDRYGSISSSDYRWVKVLDRTLYYALDQVGRRVAWTEAAGVRAHYAVESEIGSRETIPGVTLAVTALFTSLWQEVYIDEGADVTHTGINVRVFQWTDSEFETIRAEYGIR